MLIISASGQATAKLSPFLETSLHGHFEVDDVGLKEAIHTKARRKITTIHGKKS